MRTVAPIREPTHAALARVCGPILAWLATAWGLACLLPHRIVLTEPRRSRVARLSFARDSAAAALAAVNAPQPLEVDRYMAGMRKARGSSP
jgi:hypothetical protein